METILNAPFMKELVRMCGNMYRLGWNERNGGNISLRLDEGEVACYLGMKPLRTIDLCFDAEGLGGTIFAVTGTGKYFKNVEHDPELNLGIIRICPDGRSAEVLWGFSDGGRPTSELPAHLRSHIARLSRDKDHRVIMHCHSTNTLAMTYVHPLDDRSFTRRLWQMSTECIVVFPEGVGVLPWMLCGNDEIGQATARKMEEYRLCVWAQHGIFGAGRTLDETFGLIETVEKAAEIYIKVMNRPIVNTIKDSELRILAEAFKVGYRKDFLD
jgi:rhamnulose-1-phosphate aldolase